MRKLNLSGFILSVMSLKLYLKFHKIISFSLLLLITLLMTLPFLIRPIDITLLPDSRLYPLFYAISLPLTTWVILPLSVFIAVFALKPQHRILSIFILAFTTECMPSLILVNPWLPDQYPYLAEAHYIYLHGKIENVHYLNVVPGLGLTYGSFQILTNMNPITLSKLFSIQQAFLISIFTIILSKKLYGNESLLPLFFLSFNYFSQINVFHRASLHFTYALLLIYLILFSLYIRTKDMSHWKCTFLLSIVFGAMVLTYPGSGYILVTLICAYIFLAFLSRKNIDNRRLLLLLFILALIFSLWYGYTAIREIRIVTSWIGCIKKIFKIDISFPESAKHPFALGLTSEFKMIVYLRLALEGTMILLGFILAFKNFIITYLKRKIEDRKRSDFCNNYVHSLTIACLICILPWLLTEWSRWAFYKFSMYLLLFALLTFLTHTIEYIKKKRILLAALLMVTALMVPILRYASIPYLHVWSTELASVTFIHRYHVFRSKVFYMEYPPYILPRLMIFGDVRYDITSFYWFQDIVENGLYVITLRALTRDGFYTYPTQLKIKLAFIQKHMCMHYIKVYDNKFNVGFLIPQ